MPSSYTSLLRLIQPAQGDLSGTWGDTINASLTALVDSAIAGTAAVTHDDTASYTLTAINGSADEARCMFLNITGTLTAARNVVCPTSSKLYFVKNGTTGGYAFTLKTSGGTGVSVANGDRAMLYCDGVNVVNAVSVTTTADALRSATTSVSISGATAPTAGQVLIATSDVAATWQAVAGGDATRNIGYLNIPQNSKSADYTCVLGDAGKHIFHPTADTTPRTFTIPANASVLYPVGTTLTFINQHGAGSINIAITTDTMYFAVSGTTGTRVLATSGIATAVKVTSTEWLIAGTGLS